MFRRHLLGMMLAWLLCILACLLILKSTTPEAEQAYASLMSLSDQAKEERMKKGEQLAQQTRTGVSKQFLYTVGDHRLQSRLFSDQSELLFDQWEGKGELLEYFTGLRCELQEKPQESQQGQHFRCFTSQQAVYSYKSGKLEAAHVTVTDYLIPDFVGQWPASFQSYPPFLKGEAEKVQISLLKEPSLKAQGFQANLYEWEEGGL